MKPLLIIISIILIFISSIGYAVPEILERDKKGIQDLPRFIITDSTFTYQNHPLSEPVYIPKTYLKGF